jgi:hypothetical protein
MKPILLLITLFLNIQEMSFGQTKIESELDKITGQLESTGNDYIDSIFSLTSSTKDEIVTKTVDKVYDRYELLLITTNYEKVAKVYETGKPIVKSVKNRTTGIAYWNQFHENGNLKLTGYSSGYLLHIGKWEEFDEKGNLIKVTDQESGRVNFDNIHMKAIDLGISKNDIDFTYSIEDKIWIIKDWTANKKYLINKEYEIEVQKLE